MTTIEERVAAIEERNVRVEFDKGWETSWVRRGVIAAVTYCIAGIWLVLIADSNPWLKALVPVAGYILSTLTIPFFKKVWLKRYTQ